MMFFPGFRGHYTGTWGELSVLLLQDEVFENVDFCFVEYRGSVASVSALGMYLEQLITKAAAGQTPFPIAYKEFLVAAHSLGGIGLRSALLYLSRLDPALLSHVNACLLGAPSLFGSVLERSASWNCGIVKEIGLLWAPVLADLSNLTNAVTEVREEYDRLREALPENHKPISDIRWALYDRFVLPPPPSYMPPRPDTQSTEPYSHFSIVKPTNQTHPFYVALKNMLS